MRRAALSGASRAPNPGERGEVDATRVKRVALTQAFDRKQAAPGGAMALQARNCIAGARRLEAAATAQEGAEEPLVEPNEEDERAREHRDGPNMRPKGAMRYHLPA